MLCFGIHSHAAEEAHCGDIMLAVWLAIIAAVLYEIVLIPVHAARESFIKRTPFCKALWHAWTHQFWCCGHREPPLVGEDGYVIRWCSWKQARVAFDIVAVDRGLLLDDAMGGENTNGLQSRGNFFALRDASISELGLPGDAFDAGGFTYDDDDNFVQREEALSID